jgi:predicted CoA-binding protein
MVAQQAARKKSRKEPHMTSDLHSMPSVPDGSVLTVIHQLLDSQRIAVVGLSNDPSKASYRVARYLMQMGKKIIPVNPNYDAVLGLKCYARLEDVPGQIDLVNIFRRPEFCADVVRSAIKKDAKGIWIQLGIKNDEARELAEQAKIPYIEDRCIMVEHQAAL